MKVSAQVLAIPIFKVSQGTCPEVLYLRGFRRRFGKCPVYAGSRAYPFAHTITTKHPKTSLGAAAGAGSLAEARA